MLQNSSVPKLLKIAGGKPATGIAAIAAGGEHMLALRSDGKILAWGRNMNGRLGNGTTTNSLRPVFTVDANFNPITGIEDISAGKYHSLALKSEGGVLAWGYGASGQIGNGQYYFTNATPVEVQDCSALPLLSIASISGGGFHNTALAQDGRVYAWGYNINGELGDGSSFTNRSCAATVVDDASLVELTGLLETTAGTNHNLALNADGTISSWGDNSQGQLGDGTILDSNAAILVLDDQGNPVIF